LARMLLANAVENRTDVEVKGKYNSSYILPNIKENVGFDIFINGAYEPDVQDLICKLLPKNGCLLDLGANIGSIIVPVAMRRPDILAIGVEAAPWIFAYLKENVFRNHLQNVKLVNKALFDQDDVELDFFSPHDKYGKGSLSPVFTQDAITIETKKVDTLVKELDIEKVDLIKIDVEGFEYFVFKGAANLLQRPNAPVVIFEFVDWAEKRAMGLQAGDAQRLLMDMGYQLYEISGTRLNRIETYSTEGASNFLASKNSIPFS